MTRKMAILTVIRLLKPHPSIAVITNWKSIVELVLRGAVIVSPCMSTPFVLLWLMDEGRDIIWWLFDNDDWMRIYAWTIRRVCFSLKRTVLSYAIHSTNCPSPCDIVSICPLFSSTPCLIFKQLHICTRLIILLLLCYSIPCMPFSILEFVILKFRLVVREGSMIASVLTRLHLRDM